MSSNSHLGESIAPPSAVSWAPKPISRPPPLETGEQIHQIMAYIGDLDSIPGVVVELSPLRISVKPEFPETDIRIGDRISLHLCSEKSDIEDILCELTHVETTESLSPPLLVFKPFNLDLATAREMISVASLLPHDTTSATEFLHEPPLGKTTPEEVSLILREHRDSARPVVVIDSDGRRHTVRIEKLSDETTVTLCWHCTSHPTLPLYIEFDSYNATYRAKAEQSQIGNNSLVVKFSKNSVVVRKQKERRVLLEPSFRICFQHPVWPGLAIDRPLLEGTRNSLSFESNVDEDLLFGGLNIANASIYSDKQTMAPLTLVLDEIINDIPNELPRIVKAHCSLNLLCENAPEAKQWHTIMDSHLHPHTRIGATWSEHSWEVYNHSGYFDLSGKSPTNFSNLQKSFSKVSRCFDNHAELGCHAVWPTSNGIDATVSDTRIYDRTWLFHQLAMSQDRQAKDISARQVLRDLYFRIFEQPLATDELRWALIYTESEGNWNKRIHQAFMKTIPKDNNAFHTTFKLMEGFVHSSLNLLPRELEVSTSKDEEIRLTLAHIAKTHPSAYTQALDFVQPNMYSNKTKSAFLRAGLIRERQFFIAKRWGVPVAAAVAESASEGLNLFNLYDSVRLFSFVPTGSTIFPALLDATRRWHTLRGKERFVYFHEINRDDFFVSAELRELGPGDMSILSRKLIPDFMEHVYRQTLPRSDSKRKQNFDESTYPDQTR